MTAFHRSSTWAKFIKIARPITWQIESLMVENRNVIPGDPGDG